MHKYLYIVRVRRVWYALAGVTYTTSTTCVSRAMDDFHRSGLVRQGTGGVVRSAAMAEAQKNYAGQHPSYKEITV